VKLYSYTAYDREGNLRVGNISSVTEQTALQTLRATGLLPVSFIAGQVADERRSIFQFQSRNETLTVKDRERYFTSLAMLLEAGFLLPDCHRFLTINSNGPALAKFSEGILEKIQSGQSLSLSLRESKSGFDMAEIATVAAAEKSGDLAGPLLNLSLAMKRNIANREKLVSALVYPIILVMTSLASILIVAMVLVPNLMPVFEGRENEMPYALKLFNSLNVAVSEHSAAMALGALCLFFLMRMTMKHYVFRKSLQRVCQRVDFVRKRKSARIANSLASLLRGGMTLLDAIKLSASNASDPLSRHELSSIGNLVAEGKSFRESVARTEIFGPMELEMLAVAEGANRLEMVLEHISVTNEGQSIREIERLMTMLTPVMTLVMGALIGGLVYTVMRAILSINQLAQ
jgi:general secretion pathway protein F